MYICSNPVPHSKHHDVPSLLAVQNWGRSQQTPVRTTAPAPAATPSSWSPRSVAHWYLLCQVTPLVFTRCCSCAPGAVVCIAAHCCDCTFVNTFMQEHQAGQQVCWPGMLQHPEKQHQVMRRRIESVMEAATNVGGSYSAGQKRRIVPPSPHL